MQWACQWAVTQRIDFGVAGPLGGLKSRAAGQGCDEESHIRDNCSVVFPRQISLMQDMRYKSVARLRHYGMKPNRGSKKKKMQKFLSDATDTRPKPAGFQCPRSQR